METCYESPHDFVTNDMTGFGIMPLSAMYHDDEITLKVDHGFISAIYDERTRTSLFLSGVVNPNDQSTIIQSGLTSSSSPLQNFSSATFAFWSIVVQLVMLTLGSFLV